MAMNIRKAMLFRNNICWKTNTATDFLRSSCRRMWWRYTWLCQQQ